MQPDTFLNLCSFIPCNYHVFIYFAIVHKDPSGHMWQVDPEPAGLYP